MMGLRKQVLVVTERRRLDEETRILAALANERWQTHLDLARSTGLAGGRLSSAMDRLESTGLVEAKWGHRKGDQRHRRRYYRLGATT